MTIVARIPGSALSTQYQIRQGFRSTSDQTPAGTGGRFSLVWNCRSGTWFLTVPERAILETTDKIITNVFGRQTIDGSCQRRFQ